MDWQGTEGPLGHPTALRLPALRGTQDGRRGFAPLHTPFFISLSGQATLLFRERPFALPTACRVPQEARQRVVVGGPPDRVGIVVAGALDSVKALRRAGSLE